jgi:hypothetical protein
MDYFQRCLQKFRIANVELSQCTFVSSFQTAHSR